VLVLAIDERGWGALCRAITEIHGGNKLVTLREQSDRGNRSPNGTRALSRILAADRDGVILLSSNVPFLEQILRLSGPANLYAELRPGSQRHETLATARQLGLPVVATPRTGAAIACSGPLRSTPHSRRFPPPRYGRSRRGSARGPNWPVTFPIVPRRCGRQKRSPNAAATPSRSAAGQFLRA
jgi:hypothetical protein